MTQQIEIEPIEVTVNLVTKQFVWKSILWGFIKWKSWFKIEPCHVGSVKLLSKQDLRVREIYGNKSNNWYVVSKNELINCSMKFTGLFDPKDNILNFRGGVYTESQSYNVPNQNPKMQ